MISILEGEAAARVALHARHASSHPCTPDREIVALVGEAQFALEFHQPLDLARRPGGDGGADFIVPVRLALDVKTARKPDYLLVPAGKVTAGIYVLAGYSDDDGGNRRAELLGWAWGAALKRTPLHDFGGGFQSHHIARDRLRPISELQARIMRLT